MTTRSKLDRKLAKLGISELKSVERVRALQKEMLRLLRQSSVDPISYVGLEYCSPNHCGRVNCSEACWFGTLRRRVPEVRAIRRLMDQHHGALHKVIVWKPSWGSQSAELQPVNISAAKKLISRTLNSLCNVEIVAVGTIQLITFGYVDRWICEIHLIVAGADQKALETEFAIAGPYASARISKVVDLNEAIDRVTSCSTLRVQTIDRRPDAAQLTEFYKWLLNMKIGARLFRYGCDENFDPITERTITWKPRKLKHPRRRFPPSREVFFSRRPKSTRATGMTNLVTGTNPISEDCTPCKSQKAKA